jgi:two-component system chemotaxis sensor kinase CheA
MLMQYRGALMPLAHMAGDHAFATQGTQPVLVLDDGSGCVGLAVDDIVDIVREPVSIDLAAERPGVIGAALIRDAAAEIIDVGHYLDALKHEWRDQRGRPRGAKGRILLVEQNAFTRRLLTPLLEAAGYSPVEASAFEEAVSLSEAGERFDAILADVDADPTAASDFAAKIASDPASWGAPARLAMSQGSSRSHAFEDCVSKSDRSGLLAALDYAIQQRDTAA